MTECKRGDKVRITYEGTVRSHGPGVIYLDQYFAPFYTTGGATVEVLERARPKVGDTLTGEDVSKLPVGALVKHDSPGGRLRFRSAAGWFNHFGDAIGTIGGHLAGERYEILYIPDAA